MKQTRTIMLAVSLMTGASRLPGQSADTVRLVPVNILVTLPPVPTSGRVNRWIRGDSVLSNGQPATFLKPESVYGRVGPQLLFYWLHQPDCATWRRQMDRMQDARTTDEAMLVLEELRAQARQAMGTGAADSLPVASTNSLGDVTLPPESFFGGRQASSVEKLSRFEWSRGEGWSDIYEIYAVGQASCFEGARRPLAVVYTYATLTEVNPSDPAVRRYMGYTRDVLVAVGRAARQQYPRP